MIRIIKTILITFFCLLLSSCASETKNAEINSSPSQDVEVKDYESSLDLPDPDNMRGYFELNYCAWGVEITLTDVEDISGIDPSNVFTCVCELLEQKPEQQTTYCADFGILVYDMKWTKWDASGAKGTGTYSVNLCEPSCVNGTRVDAKVKVYLTDLKTDGKKYYLTKFRYEGKEPFIPGQPISETWEVGF